MPFTACRATAEPQNQESTLQACWNLALEMRLLDADDNFSLGWERQ
jgi:hypothetical protein